ncbi:MFS transporter [Jhaorihella thermophila]|uniref:Cyanate permease n=1 Tax=Jhaorihella thermophila TaxID=488547 RepID=A0A1H5SMN5_9RHOB|nr:MFS transporter [Jhaorihella thermophila]SEF51785.1 Cyanate permease [Jhaorihella thermophila]
MRLIISFTALFLSVILMQLSSGGVGPLDALSGVQLGFTTTQIGLLGSAHFLGFFIGCWWAPRLMGSAGHSRSFAAFAAVGAIGLIAHMLVLDAYAWAVMRMATGLSVAGAYTVIEAWLQAKLTNDIRARAMGTYRVVDMSGSLVAQMLIAVLEPASYVSYNILALLICLALLPLTLTRMPQPETPAAPRLKPMMALEKSPLAAAGVVVAAVSSASFRMVGPLYGRDVGLGADQIAWFLSAFVLGGAVAQFPVGWLADKFDRRWVLIWLSAAAIASCALTVGAADRGTAAIMAAALVFGVTTFPIFSVASAHAHDFAKSRERVELSAALMFLYALGAIAAPWLASFLIGAWGHAAMFAMIGLAHLLLAVIGFARMMTRPTPERRTRYVYAPRTTFLIGRLLGRQRERK